MAKRTKNHTIISFKPKSPRVDAEREARRERDTAPATQKQRSGDFAGGLVNDPVEPPHPTLAAQHQHAASVEAELQFERQPGERERDP